MALLLARAQGTVRGGTGLPAGYPDPPNTSAWTTATVSTIAGLNSEIASATSAGKIITLSSAAGATTDYGTITINRSGARIKIIAQRPRFSGLITDRATLDSVNLTMTSVNDPIIETNCVVGTLLGHTTTARMRLIVERIDILWLDGIDFYSSSFNYDFWTNRASSTTETPNQVWIQRCSFAETVSFLAASGSASDNGTTIYRGADSLIFWECYFYANGSKSDTGDAGSFFVDYGLKIYSTNHLYVYKCVFKGGFNHMLSTKQVVGTTRIDDCVFTSWDAINSRGFNMIELGQEGTPTNTSDYTNGYAEIRGCTFARTGANVVIWFKEATGMLLDDCIIYPGGGVFFDGGRINNAAGTKAGNTAGGFNILNDRGPVFSGSEDVTISNNLFGRPGALTTPGSVNLYKLFLGTGGTYTFIARTNQTSGVRSVTNGTGVTVDANTATRTDTGFI